MNYIDIIKKRANPALTLTFTLPTDEGEDELVFTSHRVPQEQVNIADQKALMECEAEGVKDPFFSHGYAYARARHLKDYIQQAVQKVTYGKKKLDDATIKDIFTHMSMTETAMLLNAYQQAANKEFRVAEGNGYMSEKDSEKDSDKD